MDALVQQFTENERQCHSSSQNDDTQASEEALPASKKVRQRKGTRSLPTSGANPFPQRQGEEKHLRGILRLAIGGEELPECV